MAALTKQKGPTNYLYFSHKYIKVAENLPTKIFVLHLYILKCSGFVFFDFSYSFLKFKHLYGPYFGLSKRFWVWER